MLYRMLSSYNYSYFNTVHVHNIPSVCLVRLAFTDYYANNNSYIL